MASITPRRAWDDGAQVLATMHPVPAALMEKFGPPRLRAQPAAADRFKSLAHSITHQQLTGKAAASIWVRVLHAVGPEFTQVAVLELGAHRLRSCGLSTAKADALIDLARATSEGGIRLTRLGGLEDQAVIGQLSSVRGIGPWTAQMFLMFDLRRIDIWPTGDLGVRAGFTKAFALINMPSPSELAELGEQFAPYRSILAWWCWRVQDS